MRGQGSQEYEDEQRYEAAESVTSESQEKATTEERGATPWQKVQAVGRVGLMAGAMMVNGHIADLNHNQELADKEPEPTPIKRSAEDYIDLEKEAMERREEREKLAKEMEPEPTQISEKQDPEFEKILAEARVMAEAHYARQKELSSEEYDRDR